MRKQRTNLIVTGHFMMIDGGKVEIDPFKTDLPARCKLALAEIRTGKKHEIIEMANSNRQAQ